MPARTTKRLLTLSIVAIILIPSVSARMRGLGATEPLPAPALPAEVCATQTDSSAMQSQIRELLYAVWQRQLLSLSDITTLERAVQDRAVRTELMLNRLSGASVEGSVFAAQLRILFHCLGKTVL